jgi:hypothetical protein
LIIVKLCSDVNPRLGWLIAEVAGFKVWFAQAYWFALGLALEPAIVADDD